MSETLPESNCQQMQISFSNIQDPQNDHWHQQTFSKITLDPPQSLRAPSTPPPAPKNCSFSPAPYPSRSPIAEISEQIQCSKLKMENKQLQFQLARLQGKHQRVITMKQQQYVQQIQNYKQNQKEFKNKNEKLEKMVGELTQQLKLSQEQVQIIKKSCSCKLQSLEQELVQKNSVINSLRQSISSLKETNNQLTSTTHQLQKHLRIKQRQIQKLSQLQQQSNNFYTQILGSKDKRSQNNNTQGKGGEGGRGGQEIFGEVQGLLKQVWQLNQTIGSICQIVYEGIQMLQIHLGKSHKHFPSNKRLLTSQSIALKTQNTRSDRYVKTDEGELKRLLELISQLIQKQEDQRREKQERKGKREERQFGVSRQQLCQIDLNSPLHPQPASHHLNSMQYQIFLAQTNPTSKIKSDIFLQKSNTQVHPFLPITQTQPSQDIRGGFISRKQSQRISMGDLLEQKMGSESSIQRRQRRSLSWKKCARVLRQYY